MVLNFISSITKCEEGRSLKILSTTAADLRTNEELLVSDQELIEFNSTGKIGQVVLCQRYIKLVQSAILLHVNIASNTNKDKMSKAQDQKAYALLVEDLTRFALKKKVDNDSRQNLLVLKLMPVLFNTGLITEPTQEKIVQGLEKYQDEDCGLS